MGAKITKRALPTIIHALIDKMREHIDAFLLVVGLGGGTGSGGAPVIARELKGLYGEPVYVLGILPSDEEGKMMAYNAINTVEELSSIADGILFFDNNLWKKEGLSLEKTYEEMNRWLIKPFPSLLGAGEAAKGKVGVKVVDAADIMNSWKGFAVLGYSQVKVKGLKEKIFFFKRRTSVDELTPTLRCVMAVKNAVAGGITSRCDLGEALRGLILLTGPKKEITIEGFSEARRWLESNLGSPEVRGGDFPINALDELRGIVLLSGFHDLPRLQELRQIVAGAWPKTDVPH
jgi:cell division GTPase FtsZ